MLDRIELLVLVGLWSLIDPSCEQGHLVLSKRWLFVRHPGDVGMGSLNHLDEQALRAVTGMERRTALTAFLRKGDRIQAQPALLLGCTVALVAMFCQERFDFAEVVDGCGIADYHPKPTKTKPNEKTQLHSQAKQHPV